MYQYGFRADGALTKQDMTNTIVRELEVEKDVLREGEQTLQIFRGRDTKANIEGTKEELENARCSLKGGVKKPAPLFAINKKMAEAKNNPQELVDSSARFDQEAINFNLLQYYIDGYKQKLNIGSTTRQTATQLAKAKCSAQNAHDEEHHG